MLCSSLSLLITKQACKGLFSWKRNCARSFITRRLDIHITSPLGLLDFLTYHHMLRSPCG